MGDLSGRGSSMSVWSPRVRAIRPPCSARGRDSRVLGLLLFSLPPFPTLDVRDSFAVVCGMCVRRTCAPNIYHPFMS